MEIWLREGQEWRVFALHLEELVGFLLADNVNHKTGGCWEQRPRLAGSGVRRHALPGGSPPVPGQGERQEFQTWSF